MGRGGGATFRNVTVGNGNPTAQRSVVAGYADGRVTVARPSARNVGTPSDVGTVIESTRQSDREAYQRAGGAAAADTIARNISNNLPRGNSATVLPSGTGDSVRVSVRTRGNASPATPAQITQATRRGLQQSAGQ